jgi:hypothetical protein
MNDLMQALSLLGAGLILLAYFALQRRLWTSENVWYLWANLLGSALLAVVAISDRRLGFILLESAWAIVSLVSLARPRRGSPPA